MSILTSNKIDIEKLRPIDYNGRKYIPLVNISRVFNLDRYAVYNATSANSKIISAYMQMIPTGDNTQSKKCIEVEGLPHLFEKLKKKVKPQILNATLKYIEENYLNDSKNEDEDDESLYTYKSANNIESSDNDYLENISNITQTEIDLDKAKEYLEKSLEEKEPDKNYVYKFDLNSAENKNNAQSYENILGGMDNLLNIAAQYSACREQIEELKQENMELKKEIQKLKNSTSQNKNNGEIARLRNQIESLEERLSIANRINDEFVSKANIINKFVSDSFKSNH